MVNKIQKINEFLLPNYWNLYHSFQKSRNNIDDVFNNIQANSE